MTTDPIREVTKHGAVLPVSEEQMTVSVEGLLANATLLSRRLAERMELVMNATPKQRAEWAAEAARREAAAVVERAAERATTEVVPLTLETLMESRGWDREYAEHLVQPYCECDSDREGGWEFCQHARDLGLAP